MYPWPPNAYHPWYLPYPIYHAQGQPWGPNLNLTPNTFYANLPPIGPGAEPPRSSSYSTLNPILAADSSPVRWDVRKRPKDGLPSSTFSSYRQLQATLHPCSHMRLYSKSFPWTIEIATPHGTLITCGDVWAGIHHALAQALVDSEWGTLMDNKKQRDIVKKAAKERRATDKDAWLKRIDWLGDCTIFRGLEKDEEFAKARCLPGADPCPETWMMKFSKDESSSWL